MAHEVVTWGRGPLKRAVSLAKMCEEFEQFGDEGLTLKEIGIRLGSEGAASRLVIKFPELKSAYQRGIDGRTVDAEAALIKRALGYKEIVKTKSRRTYNGNVEEIEKEEDMIVLPDVSALRLLLKGRENKRYSGDDDMKVGVVINLDTRDSSL